MSHTIQPREMLFIDVRAAEGLTTAYLNDVPVARVGVPTRESAHPPAPREAKPVHQLVVPGINHLRVEIDGPSTRALARLVWLDEGEVADSDSAGRLVAEVGLPPADEPGRPEEALPLVETASFDLGPAFGVPFWCAASQIVLDGETLDRAEGALRAMGNALDRGDGDRFLQLLAPYLDDALRAYPGLERVDLERIHRAYAKEIGAGGRVEVAPRERWVPRIVGGGRLLDLRDDEGAPVVTITFPDGRGVPYALLMGWRDGVSLFVR